jgi:tRNA-specific 2-thiouridylase
VPDGDHAAFVEQQTPAPSPGAIRDLDGRIVGRHDGVHHFTVGQRKGLGLSSPIPLYVVGIDAESRSVTVGPRQALERTELTAAHVNWIAGQPPAPGTRVTAQIRYRHREAPATLTPLADARVRVTFDAPQTAVAPGQASCSTMEMSSSVVGGSSNGKWKTENGKASCLRVFSNYRYDLSRPHLPRLK